MNFEIAPKETEVIANWYDAKLYCFSLNTDNKTGWRLPTKDELDSIYISENDFVGSYYWSSTETNGNYAWLQVFSNGNPGTIYKSYSSYVRAVRDIP